MPRNSRMPMSTPCFYSILTFPLTQTPTFTRVPSSFYACIFSLFTRSVKCSPTWKNTPLESLKMCPHKPFLLKCELRVSLVRVQYTRKSICLSSPEFWRHKWFYVHQKSPSLGWGGEPVLPPKNKERGSKERGHLLSRFSGQLASRHQEQLPLSNCQQHSPERGYAPKNKMSFMNHTYYWGQKPKRRRKGGKINNPLTVWL